MSSQAEYEVLRPCGRLEAYNTALHHMGFYKNVGLTASYRSSESQSLGLESTIFHGLRAVILKHPSLSAMTINEDKSYPEVKFVRLPEIDLRTCVEFVERKNGSAPQDGEVDEELNQILAKQHSRDFKELVDKQPYWRVVVLHQEENSTEFSLSWIFNHAVGDGTSAFLFHETFLEAINTMTASADKDSIIKSPNTPLIPALDDLHPMPLSLPFLLSAILGSILPSIFARRPPNLWTGNPIPKSASPISPLRYENLVLSKATTKNFAQACRREKTSVTAALQCIIASALFANLDATKFSAIKIDAPISLRRLPEIPDDGMTNAVAQYGYLHQRHSNTKPELSWDEARAVKSVIQAEVAKESRDNRIALLRYVPDIHKFFMQRLGKPRPTSATLSNIGVYKEKEGADGNWKIGRMGFTQDPNFANAAICGSVVTGGDGNATIYFCWRDGAIEGGEVFMERVGNDIRQLVDSVVKE